VLFSRNLWPAEPMVLSSWLLATFEDLLQSGFVSRCDLLAGQAEDLLISQPCSRARRGQQVFGRLSYAGQDVLQ
jgi:hypothetical protein